MRVWFGLVFVAGISVFACNSEDEPASSSTGGSAGSGGVSGSAGAAGSAATGATAGSAGAGGAVDAGDDATDGGGLSLILLTPNAATSGTTIVATGQGWDSYYAQNPANQYLDGYVFYKSGAVQNTGGPTLATQDATNKNQATFVVPTLPADTYDVAMSFRNGVKTNTLPFTIVAADAGQDSAADAPSDAPGDASTLACFAGGTAQTPTGAGTCASPFVIDLSAAAHGTIGHHATTSGSAEANISGGSNCAAPPTGTARDIVYHVKLPSDTKGMEVSVDAASGANPRIAVLEDPSCGQPANACADQAGAGACEVLFAPRSGLGFFGTSTYVVVSEVTSSGASLTTRVRSVGP